MTVTTTENITQYVGDGIETIFSFSFQALDPEDMFAFLNGINEPNIETILNGDQDVAPGGTVEFLGDPPGVDVTISLVRVVPSTQLTDYQEFDPFPAATHERALDKLTMANQQNSERTRQALQIPTGDPGRVLLPVLDSRRERYVFFDANGDVTVSEGTAIGGEGVKGINIVADSVLMLLVDNSIAEFPEIGVNNINAPGGLMQITSVDEFPGLPAGGIPQPVLDNTPAIGEAVQQLVIAADSLTMLTIDDSNPNTPILGVNNIDGEEGLMRLTGVGDYPEFPGLPGGGIPIAALENTPFLLFAVPVDDGTAQPGTDSTQMLTTFRQTNPADPFGFVDILAVNTPNQANRLLQLDGNGLIPTELLTYNGLRNRGVFRGDDLCDKPGDEPLECTVPDTRNPSQRFPELDYPPGTTPGSGEQWQAGDFFSVAMLDGETTGTMLLFAEVGDAAPAVINVVANDGLLFIPEADDPENPGTPLIEHGWYHQPGRFNLTTAELVTLDTTGYGYIVGLSNDDLQQALNFLDAALAAFRADESSFDTAGGTIIIDAASQDVQLALLDLDQGAFPRSGGNLSGDITVLHGTSPEINVQPAAAGGFPAYILRDETGIVRMFLFLDVNTGSVTIRRNSSIGVTETDLTLTANGNVNVSGAAPIELADLTRKDYVDSADAVVRAVADQALADANTALLAAQTAQAAADAAQGTANTALADAATALAAANAAQGTADTALSVANLAKPEQDFLRTGDRLDIFNVRTS